MVHRASMMYVETLCLCERTQSWSFGEIDETFGVLYGTLTESVRVLAAGCERWRQGRAGFSISPSPRCFLHNTIPASR